QPVDYLEQPWFLNCVVEAETELEPQPLLHALRQIETRMGSKKLIVKGPRMIDMDILLYGDRTIDTPELQVPHRRVHLQRFVLVPLVELASALRPPAWNANASDMLAHTPNRSAVNRIG